LTGRTRTTAAAALCALAGCAGGSAPPPSAPSDGRAILERACTTCHDLGGLDAYKGYWGEAQWRDMVATMVEHGAEIEDGEVDVLVAWLTAEYGPGSE
jgi:cytochrome c5